MSTLQEPVLEKDSEFQDEHQKEIDRVFGKLAKLELISEDGIPLESNWHRIQINLLIDSVNFLWRDRNDYFVGGNMFIYFNLEQARNKDYRGPDVFIVKNVDISRNRDYWAIWEEGGRYPDIIVELSSPSTTNIDLGYKKNLYEKVFHTQEYYCYDPDKQKLMGWQLVRGCYEELKPNEKGWLYSEELGVWLGKWQGGFKRLKAAWLRFYTENKELVPIYEEFESKRAEVEAKRAEEAEAEVQKLRALLAKHGIDESL